MPLWLVGMMGSGKSTVGRLVAGRLGLDFMDTDDLVADAAGVTAADLLLADPATFRRTEALVVSGLVDADAVVATGGGVVLDDGSVAAMRASGLVVWLDVPPEVLAARVGGGEGRPLLGDDPPTALHRLHAERAARYREAAHVVVDATDDAAGVAALVASSWGSAHAG